jgi:hypothetical protein
MTVAPLYEFVEVETAHGQLSDWHSSTGRKSGMYPPHELGSGAQKAICSDDLKMLQYF